MDTIPGLETTPEAMAESVMVLIRDADDKLKAARRMKDYRVIGILETERARLIKSYRAVRAQAQGSLF